MILQLPEAPLYADYRHMLEQGTSDNGPSRPIKSSEGWGAMGGSLSLERPRQTPAPPVWASMPRKQAVEDAPGGEISRCRQS